MHTLYHYVHCPFCIRVRMALGFLGLPWKSVVLPYDDEQTPINLAGKKMLPIMSFPEDKSGALTINESLDIIGKIDPENKLMNELSTQERGQKLDSFLNELSGPMFKLCMPYFIFSPEFDDKARSYFRSKKEAKRGPFHLLVQERKKFETEVHELLSQLESSLDVFYKSEKLTILDIILASHLWGLYIVPEFQFTTKVHNYLQRVATETKFNYHEDFWKTESLPFIRS